LELQLLELQLLELQLNRPSVLRELVHAAGTEARPTSEADPEQNLAVDLI
jgi:hypothetical protein